MPIESLSIDEHAEDRNARGKRILAGLRKLYPDADCALIHDNALQLLLATILSAQSTDENVNKVIPVLFTTYSDAQAIADAPLDKLEEIVRSTGFFRQKAKNIRNTCRILIEKHGGEVPADMAALIELPGVARKTANVVLGTWFGRNVGVVVDTHVGRLSTRLGLTWTSKDSKDAVKIEQDLMEVMPKRSWTYLSHALIQHGRAVCQARKPQCDACKLKRYCPYPTAVDVS
ncbi:MAG: endonuclease III [Phycisphaerae bacterium]